MLANVIDLVISGFIGLTVFVLFWKGLNAVGNSVVEASKPVPGPEQIRQEYVRVYGRQPTIEQVAALHQMATAEHTQKVIRAGTLVGGALLIGHTLHHDGL